MNKEQIIDEMSNKIKELLTKNPMQDIKGNLKELFIAALNKLDLVTREEFEQQKQILKNNQAKLDHLEERLKKLNGNS